jgi:aspartate kinase
LDSVIGTGEKLSARIIAAQIRQSGFRGVAIDAHDLIITNDTFGNAVPDFTLTQQRVRDSLLPMLDRQIIPVITGFIGGTKDGRPTTLGRGGSDFTASLLAVTASAAELWVWTDVDGIMTADPNDIAQAQNIPELSYDEMSELAYFGAKVLHQRMVAPLKEHNIPLCVKNVYKPQQRGTWITGKPTPQTRIKAVTRIHAILLNAEASGTVAQVSQLVDEAMFASVGVHADVMIAAQASRRSQLCYIIPTSAGSDVARIVELAVGARLTQGGLQDSWTVQQASVITAIGADLNSSTATIASLLHALDGLRILSIAQNPLGCAVSIVVEPRDSDMAMQRLHALTL